jgi:murein DD-endopeptidase MepM/ murein hydrolase activator NlpD
VGKLHAGIDIDVPVGTTVMATGAGIVRIADWQDKNDHKKGYGKRVIIDHAGGNVSVFGHLSEISVRAGQRVSRNQVIGLSGNTGASTGPHLHYSEFHGNEAHPPTGDPAGFKP